METEFELLRHLERKKSFICNVLPHNLIPVFKNIQDEFIPSFVTELKNQTMICICKAVIPDQITQAFVLSDMFSNNNFQ